MARTHPEFQVLL